MICDVPIHLYTYIRSFRNQRNRIRRLLKRESSDFRRTQHLHKSQRQHIYAFTRGYYYMNIYDSTSCETFELFFFLFFGAAGMGHRKIGMRKQHLEAIGFYGIRYNNQLWTVEKALGLRKFEFYQLRFAPSPGSHACNSSLVLLSIPLFYPYLFGQPPTKILAVNI